MISIKRMHMLQQMQIRRLSPLIFRGAEWVNTMFRSKFFFVVSATLTYQVRNEFSSVAPTVYPCVPGHEIVGRVTNVGSAVDKFKPGDIAAVGCMADSDGTCSECRAGLEPMTRKNISVDELIVASEKRGDYFLPGMTHE